MFFSERPIKAIQLKSNVTPSVPAPLSLENVTDNGGLDLIIGNSAAANDNGLQVGRMRSLPILSKQASGSVPVSARDKN